MPRVYHGTSVSSKASILARGIDMRCAQGGYFGRAFYVTEDRQLALRTYAEFEHTEEPAVVELELTLTNGCLDLRRTLDWERWVQSGLADRCSLPDLPARATRAGVDAVWDNSVDGWAIYNPDVLRIIG